MPSYQQKAEGQTARELIKEVCGELAKEIGEGKAKVEAVKAKLNKLNCGMKWKTRGRCCRWLRYGVKNEFR